MATKKRRAGDKVSMTSRVAKNVRRYLKECGLSQSELARASGLTPNYISDTINGEHLPNVAALVVIAGALGVTLDDLIA